MTDKPLTDIAFSNYDLHPSLLAGLSVAGFTRLTPIQALTLPVALSGRDVAGQAQTGTGKTLAFLIAVINRLLTRPALAERKPEDPRALILAPTRELAIQIHKDAVKFGSELGLKFALVYGGVDYDKQRELLQRGADVIIATPGRLIDYVKQHKVVSLHACEICVLDEADRMFDLGFIKDIRFLLRRMPGCKERQTLLFSATLSHRVLELAYEHMNEPEKLIVETEFITNATVRQLVYFPADEEKIPLLIGLLSRGEASRTMVFVNTKVWVERVARALERAGFRVGVLSGDVPQKRRESLLGKFQKGQLDILVATDVAARGLHIDGVSHVYNYDLPFDAEDYVHRIGRTARLGAEGDAISFACERYAQSLPEIEAFIEQKIPVAAVESDLLIARQLPTRAAAVAGEEVGESVSQIFREVREAQAAEAGRHGSSSGHGGRGASGPRSGAGHGSGSRTGAARSGGGRGRSESHQGSRSASARINHEAAIAVPSMQELIKPASVDVAAKSPASAARKRRRRRGGRSVDGTSGVSVDSAAQGSPQATAVQRDSARHAPPKPAREPKPAAAMTVATQAKPSLMGRIKQGLRKLTTRQPSGRH